MQKRKKAQKSEKGFTLIEVMLVLGLTGLLLAVILGGTFASINAQRYSDSVRDFAEYLRRAYSAATTPESFRPADGTGGSGNSKDYAILGKILVFGHDYGSTTEDQRADSRSVFAATLVGNPQIPSNLNATFLEELKTVEARLYCGQTINSSTTPTTVTQFTPTWDAEFRFANRTSAPTYTPTITFSTANKFRGTVIIARSPSSGTIHTVYTSKTYNLKEHCQVGNTSASDTLKTDLANAPSASADPNFAYDTVNICVKSPYSRQMREVRIAKDGRNTSAISIRNADDASGDEGESGGLCD